MHLKPSTPPKLQSHEEAVMYFISQMDIEMINTILDEDRTYQDFEKWYFISKLQKALDKFSEGGDTRLLIFRGHCNSCDCSNKGKSGYLFYGDKTKNYFNLIFELDDNEHVTDLYECEDFKGTTKPKFEICNRILIDDTEGDPF